MGWFGDELVNRSLNDGGFSAASDSRENRRNTATLSPDTIYVIDQTPFRLAILCRVALARAARFVKR